MRMNIKSISAKRLAPWLALACLVVPMFGSYFFDDMFSSVSFIFDDPSSTALGWNEAQYGRYASSYSWLCIFGGLAICGVLLDKWGVRVAGSLFVGLMTLGAGIVLWAITSGLRPEVSFRLACVGCTLFGLGSEIAGTAVTRSIAVWFKGGPVALAMGLHLAIARLGTATAMVLAPGLVGRGGGDYYSLAETARPAAAGLAFLLLGLVLWGVFVALDYGRSQAAEVRAAADGEKFKIKDIGGILGNRGFWLIAILCVMFYSSIIAFKKFAGAILVPRFGIDAGVAGWMVALLPFSTVVFAPLFGGLVDRKGRGTRWMVLGAALALGAHLLLAFAPAGNPVFGYAGMVLLGFGYSLVPAALWPSVAKIIPERMLGTAYALLYWVQNLGLLSFKVLSGDILAASAGKGAFRVELMFSALCVLSIAASILLAKLSDRNPSLGIDAPAGK